MKYVPVCQMNSEVRFTVMERSLARSHTYNMLSRCFAYPDEGNYSWLSEGEWLSGPRGSLTLLANENFDRHLKDLEDVSCGGGRQSRWKWRGNIPGFSSTPFPRWSPLPLVRSIWKMNDKADSCNFCEPRLKRGEAPACTVNCVGSVFTFGDINDSQIQKKNKIARPLNPEFKTKPSVYYIPFGTKKW